MSESNKRIKNPVHQVERHKNNNLRQNNRKILKTYFTKVEHFFSFKKKCSKLNEGFFK